MSPIRSVLSFNPLEDLVPEGLPAAVSRLRARTLAPVAFKRSFIGPTPDRLRAAPRDPRAGDPAKGEEIYKGCFNLAGGKLHAPRGGPWVQGGPTAVRFREEIESFAWLRHLGAIDRLLPEGVVEAREAARAFAESWIPSRTTFSEPAWSPAIVARRMISWITEGTLLSADADLIWRSRFLSALAQHARYLSAAHDLAPAGRPRLTALAGMLLGCLALGDGGPRRTRAVDALLGELDAQLLPDGGHRSRSPAVQADILADLVILRDAFLESNTPCPPALAAAVERMRQVLALFHAGNGALAAFHGSGLEAPDTILALLGDTETARAGDSSGYQALRAGDARVIVDAGSPPPLQFAATAHASAAAFELISRGQRIIVNCGPSPDGPDEGRMFRTPATHSTLSFIGKPALAATNARLAGRLIGGPREVALQRTEEDGSVLLELAHDGFAADFGRRHIRRLYLREGDLRGEDRIEALKEAAAAPTAPFRLRFHVHPDVEVAAEDTGARLKAPGGETWRFRSRGGDFIVTDSIFNGPGGPRPTKQLVIKGESALEPVAVSWAFRREAGSQL